LFTSFVPRRQKEKNTRSESSFKATDNDSECDERFVVWDKSHTDGDDSPQKHDSWEEDGGTDAS
jgi:hypothetical protein